MTSAVLERGSERQERVRTFLLRSLGSGQVSHAYLFCGSSAGDIEATARAFAQALVCPDGGCGSCGECQRVVHGTHPDVRWLEPESAQKGYLVEQVRGLIEDSALTPVRARRKVYVIRSAERLGAQAANALLKTLEEPADDVVFLLLAPSADVVLTTVRSRCSVVPFATADASAEAARVAAATGADEPTARALIAVAGTADGARALLADDARLQLRERILSMLGSIDTASDRELIALADALVASAGDASADATFEEEARAAEIDADFLSRAALKDAESRRKRAEAAKSRQALAEAVRVVEVALEDALALTIGPDLPLLDETHAALARALAARGTETVLCALDAAERASADLYRPATPALVLQVMFLRLKEALCPSSAQ